MIDIVLSSVETESGTNFDLIYSERSSELSVVKQAQQIFSAMVATKVK